MHNGALANASPVDEGTDSPSNAPPLPVKNTFIHFDGVHQQGRVRCLKRWRTDPAEPVTKTRSLSTDSRSTADPNSDSDTLDAAIDAMSSLNLEGISQHTPDQTPRSAQHPLSSPESSTAEPDSDIDPLDGAIEALASLTHEEIGSRTPEQTPRHLRVSPQSGNESASPLTMLATPTEQLSFQCLPLSAITPRSPASTSSSSSRSSSCSSCTSSPVASSFLDAAFKSLSTPSSSSLLDGGFSFGFTLRLADDVGLGLDLAPRTADALLVQRILPNGAVAAWNNQCFDGTTNRVKALCPGDTIVNVNGKTDHFEMIHECKTRMLLKLAVFRASRDNSPGLCGRSTGGHWPSTHVRGIMRQGPGGVGERLHSCKKQVII